MISLNTIQLLKMFRKYPDRLSSVCISANMYTVEGIYLLFFLSTWLQFVREEVRGFQCPEALIVVLFVEWKNLSITKPNNIVKAGLKVL